MKQLTEAQASEEYLKLLVYVEEQPHGRLLEYVAVEKATGVPMDTVGRSKLRRAILRQGREYSVVTNVGFKLADAGSIMGILSSKLARIDTSVNRADRAQNIGQKEFLESLPQDQQQGVLYLGAIFGAIKVAAENGRKLYRTKRPVLNASDVSIPIPG